MRCDSFPKQLASIMEVLAKAAVAEISKLVDGSCAVLRLEMYRYQKENEALKTKLKLMERELRAARRPRVTPGGLELSSGEECTSPVEREFEQEWSFGVWRDGESTAVEEESTPLQSVMREESADTEENTPESLLIKEERLEDNLWSRDPQPTPAEEQVAQPTPAEHPKKHVTQPTPAEEQVTQPTPAEDPEEEDLSGLEFVVKAEQEEEHVAQRLSQTGCEHSVGRLNNLDSEYVTYERDGQLWTSFTPGDSDIETDDPVCDNATEQYSQSLPVHTELQHAPAADAASANSLCSLESLAAQPQVTLLSSAPRNEEVETRYLQSEETGSLISEIQQGQTRERRLPSVKRESQTLQARQQLHGPSAKLMRVRESAAELSSDAQYEGGYTLSSSTVNAVRKISHWRAGIREKKFSCMHCGKSFDRCSHLKLHQRSHTGEKPYSCIQCGKRFSLRCNLITHQRIHTGEKPFICVHCGMSFAQKSSLKTHQRIHTGEKPFVCTQCGKRFAQSSSLKTHLRVHSRK
ncbi:zinc finger protein 24-like [Megalops cyprinoides]|uniref:zinc finger protein 24-like n=1 Tax=Megalops cyprinoides TaxID=118141 RepID=UPI001864C19C|nr:zinc finger protein 24-like [Megalops cyprinoides]